MKELNVIFCREKGDEFPVGQLVEKEHRIYFEYDSDFLKDPLFLSPFKLPPKPGLHEHKDRDFGPIFGLFDDSLPDDWGLLLMDRFLKKMGIDLHDVSVLDRLSFLGSDTMGALIYRPTMPRDDDDGEKDSIINLHDLSIQSKQIFTGESDEVLPQLMKAGGSPGGARPKVLVGVCGDRVISGERDLPPGFDHWLIKFPVEQEFPDEGPIEHAYSLMAKNAGIRMTETRLFTTKEGDRFFGIKRFDREGNKRFHVHTLGNLVHANFRLPSLDYEQFLKAVMIMTRNHEDLKRGFKQMVFNVLANNRDDHVKNFSFIMDDNGEWALSPAYDLNFSRGMAGEHTMALMGEGRSPGRNEIQEIGKRVGLKKSEVESALEQVTNAVKKWPEHAQTAGVSEKSMNEIRSIIEKRSLKKKRSRLPSKP